MEATLKVFIHLLIVFLFAGCGAISNNINKAMDSWVGSHKSELIAQWGPPTRVASDGKGGEILIYEEYRDFGYTPGRTTYVNKGPYGRSYTIETPPQHHSYTAVRMFYVNKKGIIYSWRWKGA